MKLSQLLVKPTLLPLSLLLGSLITISTASADSKYVAQPGHPSLQEWLLPDEPPYPADARRASHSASNSILIPASAATATCPAPPAIVRCSVGQMGCQPPRDSKVRS